MVLTVELKGNKHTIKKIIKGYIIHQINTHNIVCSKTIHRFLKKYNRYIKVTYSKLKVFNSSEKTLEVGNQVVLGYLGKRLSATKSHTILQVIAK